MATTRYLLIACVPLISFSPHSNLIKDYHSHCATTEAKAWRGAKTWCADGTEAKGLPTLGRQPLPSPTLMPRVEGSVWGLPHGHTESRPHSWSTHITSSSPVLKASMALLGGESPNLSALYLRPWKSHLFLISQYLCWSAFLSHGKHFHASGSRNGYSLCFPFPPILSPFLGPRQITLLLVIQSLFPSRFQGSCGQGWELFFFFYQGRAPRKCWEVD